MLPYLLYVAQPINSIEISNGHTVKIPTRHCRQITKEQVLCSGEAIYEKCQKEEQTKLGLPGLFWQGSSTFDSCVICRHFWQGSFASDCCRIGRNIIAEVFPSMRMISHNILNCHLYSMYFWEPLPHPGASILSLTELWK